MAAMIEEMQRDFPLLRRECAGQEQSLAEGQLDLAILVGLLSLRDQLGLVLASPYFSEA